MKGTPRLSLVLGAPATVSMPKLIEIKKLAAIDMAWLGPKVILVEYAFGIILPLGLGVFTLHSTFSSPNWLTWQTIFGMWLVSIAANYVPLFLYALSIARAGTVKAESEPELPHARRYGVQQVSILVPFLVVAIAVVQERLRRKPK
jgi:hypothetical protein